MILDFLDFISVERVLGKNTRSAYQGDLEQYLEFCVVYKISFLHATATDLKKFLGFLRKRGVTSRSIARKLSALRQFYKFLLRENRIGSDPTELLSVTVKGRNVPRFLSVDDMKRLIETAQGNTSSEVRDRALLEFWYATGCRISELAQLSLAHVDWDDMTVKVLGKGEVERMIPLTSAAIQWGKRYLDVRHDWLRLYALKETEVFFLSRLGKAFTRQGIWKLLKKYARKSGLDMRIFPHMIRHSFATHILQGGADLRAVQKLLGHRSISTTEIYTHLNVENLKVMQLKYHPRG